MVFIPDNKLKQKMQKNGSVLQFMYSVAGAGKGLIAMGAIWMEERSGSGNLVFRAHGNHVWA